MWPREASSGKNHVVVDGHKVDVCQDEVSTKVQIVVESSVGFKVAAMVSSAKVQKVDEMVSLVLRCP